MTNLEKLTDQTEELIRKIESSNDLSSEEKQNLLELAGEIKKNAEENKEETSDLTSLLEEKTLEFEKDHPELTRIFKLITQTLSDLGI